MRDRDEWVEVLKSGIAWCRLCSHVPEDQLKALELPGIKILGAWATEEWPGTDHSLTVLVRLPNRCGFAVLNEAEDYTGHGCQCSGSVSFYRTKAEALALGLDDFQRGEMQ